MAPRAPASRSQPAPESADSVTVQNDLLSHEDERIPPTPNTDQQLVQTLLEQIAAYEARLTALEAERQQAPAQQQAPVQQQPPLAANPVRKDPKLPPPPEFSGKISEFRNFMAQCNLVITLCPNTHSTDEEKVLFVISRLRGDAMSWARPIAEDATHALRSNYEAFKTALSNLYLDQNYKDLCNAKLRHLKQTKSVAAYSVELATLIAPFPEMDDQSKCREFYKGLNDDVKDDMAIVGPAKIYDDLVKQAIAIDQRHFQRRIEKKSDSKSQSNSSDDQKSRANGSNPRNNSSKPPATSSHSNSPAPPFSFGTKPFESRPRGPLSEEEKARREKLGLCKYCSDPSHHVKDCPRVPKEPAKVNTISLPPPRYPQTQSENSNAQAPTRTEV